MLRKFSIEQGPYGGLSQHMIINNESGESATIVDGWGASLQGLKLKASWGRLVDVVMGHATPDDLRASPSLAGAAILFPFANRIRLGRYCFMGVDYQIPVQSPRAHALHGFAMNRPWKVRDKVATDEKGSIACIFSIAEDDFQGYPFNIRVEAVFTLSEEGFISRIMALNLGKEPLPITMGLHPYLRASQSSGEKIDRWELLLPARKMLVLDDLIPTGEVVDVAGTALDFTNGRKIGDTVLDNGFTDLHYSNGVARSILRNPETGLQVELWQDLGFSHIQVYTPPSRNSIAIEPMSGAADAFNNGIGLTALRRGEETSATYGIRIPRRRDV